jgi:chemotaxis protein histidine kinase CheA
MQNKHLAQSLTEVNRNLASLNEKLESKVEDQTRDIKSILTHIEIGILTLMDPDHFRIGSNYSPFAETLLGESDLAGKNGMQLIFANSNVNPDDLSRYLSVMAASIGEDSLCWDFNKDSLCFEIEKILPGGPSKILELDWYAVVNSRNTVEKILVTMRDVSAMRQLQSHAQKQTKELEYIGEIVSISRDEFDILVAQGRDFIQENQSLLETCPQRDNEILQRLFINMHTFKGLCRSYRMKNLTSLIHAVEQKLAQLQKNPDEPWDQRFLLHDVKTLDQLLQAYIRLGQEKLNHQLEQKNRLIIEKASLEAQLTRLREIKLASLSDGDRDLLISAQNALQRMIASHSFDIFNEIQRSIGRLSQDLGKEEPLILIDNPNLTLSSPVQALLRNIFLHLIRNSMDHGIEAAEDRIKSAKPSQGRIHISLHRQTSTLVISYNDDGRGLNIKKLRQIGKERGLLNPTELKSDRAVANLIFTPSFSTAETISDVSGRGMGMAAVVDYLDEFKGSLDLEFTSEESEFGFRSFKLTIRIPIGPC